MNETIRLQKLSVSLIQVNMTHVYGDSAVTAGSTEIIFTLNFPPIYVSIHIFLANINKFVLSMRIPRIEFICC